MATPSDRQLERHIRTCSLDTENIYFKSHAKQRMRERYVTPAMVYEVLQQGVLAMPPEPDSQYPGVRCRMHRYVAGMELTVVVHVDHPRPDLLVITVIDLKGN